MQITLDSEGRLPLPPEIQQQLGVKPGDAVILESQGGGCFIRPRQENSGLAWKGNVLIHQGVSDNSPERILAEVREQRLDPLCEGIAE
jgi:bifunctional DNA-binding transcriptional regulator/antitoxin component of YhaV-PrlF toxin-antitoxin module